MKSNKLILGALVLSAAMFTGCRDEFAETNASSTAVTKGNASQLFLEAVWQFEPQGYLEYYYNSPMKYRWSGMGIAAGGASDGMLTMTATGDQGGQYIKTLRYVRDIENLLAGMSDEDKATNMAYLHAAKVLTIYLGLFDTDMVGDIPYTEACMLRYGGALTPKYDRMADLYDLWLKELDEAIAGFSASTAAMANNQDVIFKGDMKKWAKFANSLKLRFAARLVNKDNARAKSIVAAVKSASCGYIDDMSDDVMFNKSTDSNKQSNDYTYHWYNSFDGCSGREAVINFMVGNQDPRVRFFYTKNQWNSKIVQGYWDAGKEIPPFIEANVNYTVGADGKKHFESWAGLGEPWVRYYGVPEEWMAGNDGSGKYKWYWPSSNANFKNDVTITDEKGSNPSTYTVYSNLNRMMIIGNGHAGTSPGQVSASTLPDDIYTFSVNDRPWYGMYLSASEVNLYLAEFAMLDGQEAQAKQYYDRALELSVKEYDNLARLNQVAYYSTIQGCFGYDDNEGAIDLKDGEIATMMAQDGYAFTGTAAEKLEKIYIQQLLNFTLVPNEQYVTARRSGYPAFDSNLLPRIKYADVTLNKIPRRYPTGAISPTDIMKDVRAESYKAQGLTVTASGNMSDELANERLWIDEGNPAWGAGR